jgi:hypothetical protein
MTFAGTAALALVILSTPGAAAAQAQSPPAPQPGRLEVALGSLWMAHQALGSNSANETTSTGSSLKIFSTSSDLAGAAGLEGRVGVRVGRGLEAEVDASYAKPLLRIAIISTDVEAVAPVTATETIQQFTIGAGVVWYLPYRARRTTRLAPFVMAGAGYLRQLHEAATLLETGRFYQFGGGVKYLLVSHPTKPLKGVGARLDVRALVRSKGIAFDAGHFTSPAIGASLFVRF